MQQNMVVEHVLGQQNDKSSGVVILANAADIFIIQATATEPTGGQAFIGPLTLQY